jgi:hypothetical protein
MVNFIGVLSQLINLELVGIAKTDSRLCDNTYVFMIASVEFVIIDTKRTGATGITQRRSKVCG